MEEICRSFRDLKPGLNRFGRGLYVRVRGGARSWIFKYQFKGVRREIGLGSIEVISVSQAKSLAQRNHGLIAEGVDPKDFRDGMKEEFAAGGEPAGVLFGEFVVEAIAHVEYLRRWSSQAHARQWRTSIETYVTPFLGEKELASITTDDIVNVLRAIWVEKTETAKRIQERLAIIFSYAATKGLVQVNPAEWSGRLEHFLPSPTAVRAAGHHAAVPAVTLKAVVAQLLARDTLTSRACVFGILTTLRAQEFCKLRWDEVDLIRCTATIPPERRKDRRPEPFVVPLSRQARECILGIPRDSEYVFGNRPGHSLSKNYPRVYLREHCRAPITMHGCRSTFSDWCAQNEKDYLVAEKCLMHSVGGKVFMAYQRDDLLDRRRKLLEEWAEYLMPTNAIPKAT